MLLKMLKTLVFVVTSYAIIATFIVFAPKLLEFFIKGTFITLFTIILLCAIILCATILLSILNKLL